jgi:hypothetical protein
MPESVGMAACGRVCGSSSGSSRPWAGTNADAIDDVRKVDPNLQNDHITAAAHAPKKIVEALPGRAK